MEVFILAFGITFCIISLGWVFVEILYCGSNYDENSIKTCKINLISSAIVFLVMLLLYCDVEEFLAALGVILSIVSIILINTSIKN